MPHVLAPSYSRMAVREPGAVAADAEYKKTQKYMHLTSSHFFVPVTVERECGGCSWVHGGDGGGLVGFNFSHVLCSSCCI